MAKKTDKNDDQFQQVEQALSKTEQYIEDNQKLLTRIVGGIVGIIALIIGINNLYLKPMSEDAKSDMYMAQIYFEQDSFNLALNGDGQFLGFIDIADDYSLVKEGKLASYYAGVCYMKLSDYENAIEYLEDFSSDDILLSSLSLGLIGDAHMELGDTDEALDYYRDAAENNPNDFVTPIYMFKQAMIYEQNGDYEDALDIYNTIKSDYKESQQANEIDKYISRIESR